MDHTDNFSGISSHQTSDDSISSSKIYWIRILNEANEYLLEVENFYMEESKLIYLLIDKSRTN